MPCVLCRRYPGHNVVVGRLPHTTKLFLLFNHTIIIVDHFWLAAKAVSHILGPFSDTEMLFLGVALHLEIS